MGNNINNGSSRVTIVAMILIASLTLCMLVGMHNSRKTGCVYEDSKGTTHKILFEDME